MRREINKSSVTVRHAATLYARIFGHGLSEGRRASLRDIRTKLIIFALFTLTVRRIEGAWDESSRQVSQRTTMERNHRMPTLHSLQSRLQSLLVARVVARKKNAESAHLKKNLFWIEPPETGLLLHLVAYKSCTGTYISVVSQ